MQCLLSKSVRGTLSILLMAGCLSTANAAESDYSDQEWHEIGEDQDPWEGLNRKVYRFNERMDRWVLKPVAQGYQKVTPQIVEDGVHNVFRNMTEVRNLTNNILQFKLHDAGVDTARFLFNTTFGVLGFFDVATKMGLQRNDEDLGQTLGAWGVQSGPYVMLPFLGPSTLRDTATLYPESLLGIYEQVNDVPARNSMFLLDMIDLRASALGAERLIVGDRYRFIRNAYLQNREFKVRDGNVEDDF